MTCRPISPAGTGRRPGRGRRGEAGSALLIVTMITVILTLLGISYLVVADQENSISVNQRNADQLTFVGEAGARMVKAWFDRPVDGDPNSPVFKFMGDYDLRLATLYDRTQRIFDNDNDPNTPDVLADGTSSKPYFRQGLTVGSNPNYLTFWDKPYRGSAVAEFRGTEAGPDIVIESNNTSVDWLDVINQRVIGANRTLQENVGRIQRIDVYAPPVIEIGGVRTRYGIATVKVTAAKFRNMGQVGVIPVTTASSVEVGRQVVKMVINEVPYPGPAGPFHSCTDFDIGGAVQVHWGQIIAGSSASLGTATQLVNRSLRTIPWENQTRYVDPNLMTAWIVANDGKTDTDFDPWWQLRAGVTVNGAPDPNAVQLYPYVPITTVSNDATALFQNSPSFCPDFDYQTWKNVAKSGGKNVHYMTYAGSADAYQEDGTGPVKTVQGWVNGKQGFWFFDTTDKLPPDPNGANVAPAIGMSGNWSSAGFIYLNADWDSAGGGSGVNRVIVPPGEPWYDRNGDGIAQPGEYVNLQYPTNFSQTARVWKDGSMQAQQSSSITTANGITYSYTTDPNARDDQGPPFLGNVHFQGVFYIRGTFEFTGNMNVFGAIVTRGGMSTTLGAGTPDVWFDERLVKGGWPPPELQLPRTMVTVWETNM